VGLLLIVLGGAYFQITTALAVARAEKADAERTLAEARAGEAVAQSAVAAAKASEANARSEAAVQDTRRAEAEAASSKERERLERENKIVETATRRLSQAYRYQYADPFTAAAEVYASTQSRALDDSEQVMNAIHDVLLERRATSIRERTIVRHGSFSFSSQSYEGERYTTLSRDGSKVLIITGRGGDPSSSELPGDVYVLDNGTTQMAPLNSCKTPDRLEPSRLEFAAFLGQDKVIVARSLFHVDIYTVTGTCVGSFYLLKTKTPVTAAGGMLHDAFFIAGNGAGCVWVRDYRKPRFIEPSKELGVVSNCDDKNDPNAVTQVLANSRGNRGMLVFQWGRIDLFELDGPNGRPKRRTVVKQNGRAVAFERGGEGSTFAVSYGDRATQKLELWDSARSKPAPVRTFSLEAVDEPVDFLGFPSDGPLLIGIDAACALHFWDREDGRHLLKRAPRGAPCMQPVQPDSGAQ
jgi:hypothetical protein